MSPLLKAGLSRTTPFAFGGRAMDEQELLLHQKGN
jgi:hypothetical protein